MTVPAGSTASRHAGGDDHGARAHGGLGPAALMAAVATSVVLAPVLLIGIDIWNSAPGFVAPVWFAVLFAAAPVTALLWNRRRPVATTFRRALLVGLPQLPLVVALMWLRVTLEVRSGDITAGTEMVTVAFTVGTAFAAGLGLLLTVLVTAAARFATTHARP